MTRSGFSLFFGFTLSAAAFFSVHLYSDGLAQGAVMSPNPEYFQATSAKSSTRTSVSSLSTIAPAGAKAGRRSRFLWRRPAKPIIDEKHVNPNAPLTQRGVYLTASSARKTEFVDQTMDALLKAGGNTFIVDVKGSYVYFQSNSIRAKHLDLIRPMYELPAIIEKAHAKGIQVLGRFIAIKDDGITSRTNDVLIRHPKTGRMMSPGWVDPSNPLAIEYNMQVLCELAEMGIDEVNLDYIRFSTAHFGELTAFTGPEKADRLEIFLKNARETIDRCGPNTRLGISTYAILGWNFPVNFANLGQDIARFAPLVDVISPMAYPATFAAGHYYAPGKDPGPRNYFLVYRTMTGYRDLLPEDQRRKLRPWIQGYGVTSKDVLDEIRAVKDAGACGITVWNASNYYEPTYKAMGQWKEWPETCGE